jgi:hypothetical protein
MQLLQMIKLTNVFIYLLLFEEGKFELVVNDKANEFAEGNTIPDHTIN